MHRNTKNYYYWRKMIMKKILALLMAGAMAATAFAGCAANVNSNSNSDATKGEESSAASESDWAYISDKGKMTIGITYFEPMSSTQRPSTASGTVCPSQLRERRT